MRDLQVLYVKDMVLSRIPFSLDKINKVSVNWESNRSTIAYEREFLTMEECIHLCYTPLVHSINSETKYLIVVFELHNRTEVSYRVSLQGYLYVRSLKRSLHFLNLETTIEFDEVEDEFTGFPLLEDLSLYLQQANIRSLTLAEFLRDLEGFRLNDEADEIRAFLRV